MIKAYLKDVYNKDAALRLISCLGDCGFENISIKENKHWKGSAISGDLILTYTVSFSAGTEETEKESSCQPYVQFSQFFIGKFEEESK